MVDKGNLRNEHVARVRQFILDHVEDHPADLGRLVGDAFGLSREAVSRHLRKLVAEGSIESNGRTRARTYGLRTTVNGSFKIGIEIGVEEDAQWRRNLLPLLRDLPPNVVNISHYGFTEMFNNVIDHSESPDATYRVERTAVSTQLSVLDRGIGIFEKVRSYFGLEDARHALLELSKGKLTSDPESHTGEGIFFASRMFDEYSIQSGTLFFKRINRDDVEWLLDVSERAAFQGTLVQMKIRNDTPRTAAKVFEQYATSDEDLGFKKTIVPVKLVQYEGEKLVSRSQAKRLVARFDRFVEVILDFSGVTDIGPAFADEIFRVYAREHPRVHLWPMNASAEVSLLIARALSGEAMDQLPLL